MGTRLRKPLRTLRGIVSLSKATYLLVAVLLWLHRGLEAGDWVLLKHDSQKTCLESHPVKDIIEHLHDMAGITDIGTEREVYRTQGAKGF